MFTYEVSDNMTGDLRLRVVADPNNKYGVYLLSCDGKINCELDYNDKVNELFPDIYDGTIMDPLMERVRNSGLQRKDVWDVQS